ncbi:thiamine ABC transporter substrate-binding protein [Natronomonas salsuginis]|jgi:thiamine transport system substrate-binding protein|uniref:Thiamine ABC transporter substrate-binding protein n=1 Tax=Natronomonas salsuginis TaxID=2217661 RepID=A0A4U5JE52_9EURY|nr:thiamine ABC transporter substrate-binding protein [Natronomonas salsuginis]TKR26148.1 thiamine ABC transporter substrate-binding protein [Natronomonas salsuginis]
MRRRTFVSVAGGSLAALSGCLGNGGENGNGNGGNGDSTDTRDATETEDGGTATPVEDPTITIATYDSFVDGEDPVGPWLKSEFEAEYDATVEFRTPSSGINQYIQRAQQGAEIDVDLYVGLNVDELIRIDEQLDSALFDSLDGEIDGSDRVRDELRFDPDGRAIPYDTGYISLVYDEREVTPKTFEDLTDSENAGELIVQNAQQSDPGVAFLLWTIHEFGADGYLDYWSDLQDNDVRVLGSWDDAYNAYLNEEASMVVSYSTDQVYYGDQPRHQVGFLNDQGYAQPEGMARFADAPNPDAARELMEFMLRPDVQGVIAQKNVQFPAVADADLDEEFDAVAHVPPEPVTFGYDELAGNLDGWIEAWARQIVG